MSLNIIYILFYLSLSFQSNEQIFESANNYYSNGDYNSAISLYLQIVDSGYASPSLYYNLGNSHYKLNNIAESNYYFEMAKKLSPNDSDINLNLSFAQNMRVDKIEKLPISQLEGIRIKIINLFSVNSWNILFLIFIWLLCISVFLYIYYADPFKKKLFFNISIVLVLISSLIYWTGYEKKIESDKLFGIIYPKEIEVWSEPNKLSELKFLLHEGTKVELINQAQDWTNIRLENGTTGWLYTDFIKSVK